MTPATFKARFPEFNSEDDTRIQVFIDDSDIMFDTVRWGNQYEQGVANLVAHELTLANFTAKGGSAVALKGNYTSKKVDGVEIQIDSAIVDMQAKDPYMRTVYGQKYRYLARLVGRGAVSV